MKERLLKLIWNPKIQIPLPKICLDDISQQSRKDELGNFVFLIGKDDNDLLFDIGEYKKSPWDEYFYGTVRELGYNFTGYSLAGSENLFDIYRVTFDEFKLYLDENRTFKREIHPNVLMDLGLMKFTPHIPDYRSKND